MVQGQYLVLEVLTLDYIYEFLSCRPLVVNATFSTGLLDVENVVLTTKDLQERNTSGGWYGEK